MQSRGWVNGRDTNFLRRANSVNWSNFSPKVNYFTAWWAWWNSFAYLRGLGRSFTLSTRFGKDQLRDITWFGAARNLTLHQCIDLQCVTMVHHLFSMWVLSDPLDSLVQNAWYMLRKFAFVIFLGWVVELFMPPWREKWLPLEFHMFQKSDITSLWKLYTWGSSTKTIGWQP